MHKQHRGNKAKFLDQNRELPAHASDLIRSVAERLAAGCPDEGSDTALTYLCSEYLSKFMDEGLTPAVDRRQAAIDKFVSVELRNAKTNETIRSRDPGYNILPRVTWVTFLSFARRLIATILGDLSDEIVLGGFSGGASTRLRRTESHPAQKYIGQAHATKEAVQFVETIYRQAPLLRKFGSFDYLQEVEGAALFTVPKKTDIDRCACKEPEINMYLQRGVGNHIRRRLRRFGINLNDQSVNRRLARDGSIAGNLATVDLSSASDMVTIELVRTLLPPMWFEYLNDIRSQRVLVEGTYFRTEMFSSMGNGFTFELESLLFYALMRTTSYMTGTSGIISIYGDDIIIPCEMADDALWVLGQFGFSPNTDKTFTAGPFRESCGGHYHNGDDVTPFYLRKEATRLTDVIRVANRLRFWALEACSFRQYVLPATYKVWRSLAELVPTDLWGGSDYEVDTQLVAPAIPINRLVRLTEKRRVSSTGAYLLWQNSYWNRRESPEEGGFEPSQATNRCRLKRAKPGATGHLALFSEELTPYIRSNP